MGSRYPPTKRAVKVCLEVNLDRLLTQPEAAKLLRLSENTLRQWRARGRGPRFVRLSNRAIRYRNEDLEDFVDERIKEELHPARGTN